MRRPRPVGTHPARLRRRGGDHHRGPLVARCRITDPHPTALILRVDQGHWSRLRHRSPSWNSHSRTSRTRIGPRLTTRCNELLCLAWRRRWLDRLEAARRSACARAIDGWPETAHPRSSRCVRIPLERVREIVLGHVDFPHSKLACSSLQEADAHLAAIDPADVTGFPRDFWVAEQL